MRPDRDASQPMPTDRGGGGHYNFSFEHPHPYPQQHYPGAGSSSSYYHNVAGPSNRQRELPDPHSFFRRPFMPSAQEEQPRQDEVPPPLTGDPSFDILDWHPAYQSCQRFFLDHAQHEQATQALCALINIRLPFQYLRNPIISSNPADNVRTPPSASSNYTYPFPRYSGSNTGGLSPSDTRNRNGTSPHHQQPHQPPTFISLIPYIRRLIVTGFDKPAILHGFFGDDYIRGILPHLDCERRNYLFAAKQSGWSSCKSQYDVGSGMGGDESVPFMNPLDKVKVEELMSAEKYWSGWLAMEDWMVGPRAPGASREQEDGGRDERDERGGRREENGAELQSSESHQLPDGVPEAFGE